jgi:hypothetical protein
MLETQTPANFHARRKRGVESCERKARETHKRCNTWYLDSPQTKTVFIEMLLDAIHHCIAVTSVERLPEEFHHSGIGVHCRKRIPILVTPLTKANAAAGQFHKGRHLPNSKPASCNEARQ